jgi:hypothetical protein
MQRSPHDIPDSSDLLKEWCLAVPWSIVPTGKSTKALTYFGGGACCAAFEPEFIFRASLAWRCSQRLIGPGGPFRSQRDGSPCAFPENPWGFSPGGVSNLSGSVDFPKCYAARAIHPLCLRIGHGHPSGIRGSVNIADANRNLVKHARLVQAKREMEGGDGTQLTLVQVCWSAEGAGAGASESVGKRSRWENA